MLPRHAQHLHSPSRALHERVQLALQAGTTHGHEAAEAQLRTCMRPRTQSASDLDRCCAELSPLTVKVEKGSVSRLFVRPIRSAFLNVSSTVPPKANPDEFQSLATNEGLVYIQYSASGTTNTKFTASMGEQDRHTQQPWV